MPAYGNPITDKSLLAQLEGSSNNMMPSSNSIKYESPVNDPQLLKQLNEPDESYGESRAMAAPRILLDIGNTIADFVPKIPHYINKGLSEIGNIPSLLNEHPGHAAAQAMAGLAEHGQDVFNMPHDIANYISNRLHLIPQDINEEIQKGRMPNDTQGIINSTFGHPEYGGEELIKGITKYPTLSTVLGKAALYPIKVATSTKKSIANAIIKPHDILENTASKGFQTVAQEVEKRNLPNVPIDQNLIGSLTDYFPKTKQAASLLNAASTGEYGALRKIQSQLYNSGKKNLNSPLDTDRMKGEEMFEKREDINQAISNHLQNLGQHDLNKTLNKARDDYKKLQEIYFNPNLNNAITNMVDKDIRKIPKNLVDVLTENSVPMKNLINFHPGLQEKISRHLVGRKIGSGLTKFSAPLGAGALGAYGTLKYMFPERKE